MNKIMRDFAKIRDFFSRDALIAGSITGCFSIFHSLIFPPRSVFDAGFSFFLAFLIACAIANMRSLYLGSLTQREVSKDNIVWDIELNGVKVGTITDSDYAAIRRDIFRDKRVYVALLVEFGKAVFAAFNSLLYAIPAIVFWFAVLAEICIPGSIASVISSLRNATPSEIRNGLVGTANMIEITVLFYTMLALAFGKRFGFRNSFDSEMARRLRARCLVAADGDVSLVRWSEGGLLTNSELSNLREYSMQQKAIKASVASDQFQG